MTIFEITDKDITIEPDQTHIYVMGQLSNSLKHCFLDSLQFSFRQAKINYKENPILSIFTLDILFDLSLPQIIVQRVSSKTHTADPSFSVPVFGTKRAQTCLAFNAQHW